MKSSDIDVAYRSRLLSCIRNTIEDMAVIEPLKIEFFRGDSFQIIVNHPEEAMRLSILLRAGLKANTPIDSKMLWDARLSLGIGTIAYEGKDIAVSDGEAFQYSGRGLDKIGKKRLVVKSRWEEVDNELRVSSAFADNIISAWTRSQAQAVYYVLLSGASRDEIAMRRNQTVQNIGKLQHAARITLIQQFIARYRDLINNVISNEL